MKSVCGRFERTVPNAMSVESAEDDPAPWSAVRSENEHSRPYREQSALPLASAHAHLHSAGESDLSASRVLNCGSDAPFLPHTTIHISHYPHSRLKAPNHH